MIQYKNIVASGMLMIFSAISNAHSEQIDGNYRDVISSVKVDYDEGFIKKIDKDFRILLSVHTGKPRRSAIIEIDSSGNVVFSKEFDSKIAFNFDYSVTDGYFYALEKKSENACNFKNHDIYILGKNKNENRVVNAINLVHTNKHDFDILSNGNIVVNSYEPSRSSFGTDFDYRSSCVIESVVQEIDKNENKVIFEWHSLHSIPVDPNFYNDNPKRGEYAHLNSTDLNEITNEYLFSLRGVSQLAVVSRKNGKTIYKIGGVNPNVEIISDPYKGFCGQHQAEWTSQDSFLLFDNGDNKFCTNEIPERTVSRVAEYQLDRDSKTAELVWQYESPDWHGTFAGGTKRMSNGLTAISWGNHVNRKQDAPTVTIVTPEGKVVWELTVRFKGEDGVEVTPVSYRANVREM